jgi:hypothetical protein
MNLKLFCVPCFVEMRAQRLKIYLHGHIIIDKKGVSFDDVFENNTKQYSVSLLQPSDSLCVMYE